VNGALAAFLLLFAQVETNPAGQVDLPRLADLAAQRLHVNLQYDANALKTAGAATLRLEAPLSDRALWDLLNETLAERGLTTVRTSGGYSIVKLADAAGVAQTGLEGEGPNPGYRSVQVQLRSQSAKSIAEALGKVLSKPGGSAVAIADSAVVIADLSPRVDQALTLLKTLDSPGQASVEDLKVQNLSAPTLALLVMQVAAKRDAIAGQKTPGEVIPSPNGNSVLLVCPPAVSSFWKGLIAELDQREKVETVMYTPKAFGVKDVGPLLEQTARDAGDDRWKMVVDELTRTLIITAAPRQHEKIKALLDRLDASAAQGNQRTVRAFAIKNRPVKDLRESLDQMVSTGIINADLAPRSPDLAPWPPVGTPTAPGPPPATQPSKPRAPNGAQPAAPPLVLSADEATNTLIAMGEPAMLSSLESLIQSLDVRQPQVLLEVLIVSLSESQTLDLGVEIEKLITSGDTRTTLASLFGLSTRSSAGDPTPGTGSGFTGLVLSPGDFSVVLRALQTLNKGRSLSLPRLLVSNNQQATLDAVLTQPYASTNASNTVTTTSFGGSQDAGTQVSLKPQIAGGGDHLNLEYQVSLSAFVGSPSTANLPPPRQANKVQSAAALPDGYTVVVGGIELTSEGKNVSQVPGLGNIPVLGEAFKSRTNTASRSRFYVFIRATIQRSGSFEDLKYASDVAGSAAGIDDGFPKVEPLVLR
jgi:general secretion pathway protein D